MLTPNPVRLCEGSTRLCEALEEGGPGGRLTWFGFGVGFSSCVRSVSVRVRGAWLAIPLTLTKRRPRRQAHLAIAELRAVH